VPPPARKGCKGSCHLIWFGRDGQLVIGCAHCWKVSQKIDFAGGEELLARQCEASRKGHKRSCARPVR